MHKIAIIGTGRVARARARDLQLRDDITIASISPSNPSPDGLQRAAVLAASCNAVRLDSWLDVPKYATAAMVCCSNPFHYQIAKYLLENGLHVSVDYPLAIKLSDCIDLYTVAQQYSKTLHVEHIDLLSSWFRVFLAGMRRVGRARLARWENMVEARGGWSEDRAHGETFFKQAAIASRLVALFGEAQTVAAYEQLWEFEEGRYSSRVSLAIVEMGEVLVEIRDCVGLAGACAKLEVIGERGKLRAEGLKRVWFEGVGETEELEVAQGTGLFAEDIDWFIKEIEGATGYAPRNHVLETMRLADALSRSIRGEGRVRIERD